MLIDFTQKITDLDGQVAMDGDKPLTLAGVTVTALLATLIGQRGEPEQLTGEKKVQHALIAQQVYKAEGVVDLKVEEVALIKERVGRTFPPLTVMQAWEMLDPTEVPQ